MSKKKLKFLIILNLIWSILGIYADWAWLSSIPLHFVPLTAICSLYPPLLLIWYLLKYYQIRIPQWFTFWIVFGTTSYGLLAQFYFPLLMSWQGINWHDLGSMLWVAVYGFQSLILLKQLRPLRWPDLLPGTLYLLAADATHYFIPTFVDFNIPGYPSWMRSLTTTTALTTQTLCFLAILVYTHRKTILHPEPQP